MLQALHDLSDHPSRISLLQALIKNMYFMLQLKWAAKLGVEMHKSSSGLNEKREYHTLLKDKFQIKKK